MQGEDLIVSAESKTLRTFRRLAVALPVLALPFVPAVGKAIAGIVLWAALAHTALQ